MHCSSLLVAALALAHGLVDAAAVRKCSVHKAGHSRPTLDQVKESFYEAKIVPDLLPTFNPTPLLYLTYESDSLKDSRIVLPGKRFAKDGRNNDPPRAYARFLISIS